MKTFIMPPITSTMHVTIRRYKINAGATQQLVDSINEHFVPLIREAPRFVAYYAVDEGDGDVTAISIFEDEASAIASNQLASQFVMKHLSALIPFPPKIISGDVVATANAGEVAA